MSRLPGLLLLLQLLLSCGGGGDSPVASTDQEPLRIGLLVPFSGAWAPGSASWRQSADMAVAEINDSGGVFGRPLSIEAADTETIPDVAVLGAQSLVERDIVAVIGAGTSGSTIAVAEQVLIPNGILLISPSSTSPRIAELADNDLVWRTAASDLFQGSLAAQWAWDHEHRTASILYVNNAYGTGLSDTFTKSFERLGGRVLSRVAYPELAGDDIDDHSYAMVVEQVFEGAPDLVYLITYDQDGAKISVSASSHLSADYTPTFLGCDGNTSQAFIDNSAPVVIEGMVGTVPSAPADAVDYRLFAERYERLFGVTPGSFSESVYDAVYLLALAMLSGGSSEPAQIARHMQAESSGGTRVSPSDLARARSLLATGGDIDYSGASGSVDFDDHGDLLSGTYRIWQVRDGAFTTLQTVDFP